jgi:hypothetical protein
MQRRNRGRVQSEPSVGNMWGSHICVYERALSTSEASEPSPLYPSSREGPHNFFAVDSLEMLGSPCLHDMVIGMEPLQNSGLLHPDTLSAFVSSHNRLEDLVELTVNQESSGKPHCDDEAPPHVAHTPASSAAAVGATCRQIPSAPREVIAEQPQTSLCYQRPSTAVSPDAKPLKNCLSCGQVTCLCTLP